MAEKKLMEKRRKVEAVPGHSALMGERGDERQMDRKFWIRRCKLLYVGWISTWVLPYSTGNNI